MGVLSRRLPFLRTAQGRVSCRETICGFFEVLSFVGMLFAAYTK